MLNPYAILGAVLLMVATALGGIHVGKKLEREAWQAEKLELLADQAGQLHGEFIRYERAQKFNDAKARKATENHDKALTAVHAHYATEIAAVKRNGGLRIPRGACAATQNAGTAEGPGAGGPDEGAAATIRIPEETESRLFALAEDADKLSEQLRALQGWIRANGHYGEMP